VDSEAASAKKAYENQVFMATEAQCCRVWLVISSSQSDAGCQRIPDQAQSLGQDSLRMRLVDPQGTDKIPSRLIYV
jgi:hypothetical protein